MLGVRSLDSENEVEAQPSEAETSLTNVVWPLAPLISHLSLTHSSPVLFIYFILGQGLIV